MKLLLIFAFLVLVCMARSAPPPTTPRLLFPDYQEADQDVTVPDTNNDDDDDQDNDEDPEEDTTTTTTTTTRRSSYMPTRNRNVIPTRRPIPTSRFTPRTTTTTTTAYNDDDDESTDSNSQYDGDFKYIRDFRVYVQKLLADIRKLVRNLTGYDFMNNQARQQYNYPTHDD